jgi:hypothetical protein
LLVVAALDAVVPVSELAVPLALFVASSRAAQMRQAADELTAAEIDILSSYAGVHEATHSACQA